MLELRQVHMSLLLQSTKKKKTTLTMTTTTTKTMTTTDDNDDDNDNDYDNITSLSKTTYESTFYASNKNLLSIARNIIHLRKRLSSL